jgi:hypothetical protein
VHILISNSHFPILKWMTHQQFDVGFSMQGYACEWLFSPLK